MQPVRAWTARSECAVRKRSASGAGRESAHMKTGVIGCRWRSNASRLCQKAEPATAMIGRRAAGRELRRHCKVCRSTARVARRSVPGSSSAPPADEYATEYCRLAVEARRRTPFSQTKAERTDELPMSSARMSASARWASSRVRLTARFWRGRRGVDATAR